MSNTKTKTLVNIEQAIEELKKECKCNFDSTVELHINLNVDPRKADQAIRFSMILPNGTGKSPKVAVFASGKVENADLELSENDLTKIEKGTLKPKVDFDALIAEPKFMSKIAKVAKILGPAGVMPSPKNGTVTENVSEAVDQIKKGKVEVKTEQTMPIIHTIIGKRSFETQKLVQNFNELITTLKQNKPTKAKIDWIQSIFVSTSMSGSQQIDLNTL